MMFNLYFTSIAATLAIVSPVFINAWPEKMGCFEDDKESRLMRGSWIVMKDLTVQKCAKRCQGLHYKYAGVQNGKACHCSNKIEADLDEAKKPDCLCCINCAGDKSEKCGGIYAMQIYKLEGYMGCYLDDWDRMMHAVYDKTPKDDVHWCQERCGKDSYSYAGLENGDECFCDNKIDTTKYPLKPEADCNKPCVAKGSEICGGPLRLSVYYLGHGNAFVGCYKQYHRRCGCHHHHKGIMEAEHAVNDKNTQTSCMAHCKDKGYAYAGIKNGKDCFCDNAPNIYGDDYRMHPDKACNTPCPGDSSQMCGGKSSWAIFKIK